MNRILQEKTEGAEVLADIHRARRQIVVNDPRVAKFVARAVGSTDDRAHTSIGVEDAGDIVAGILYDNWNPSNVCMHVAAKPGVNWVSRALLKLVFGYAFDGLRVKRVTGVVPASNTAARRFDEHLGFKLEARLKDAAADGDMLLYVMFRKDCRYLGVTTKDTKGTKSGTIVPPAVTGGQRHD